MRAMKGLSRRLPLLALLLLLVGGMARAADPVGTWAVDEDAFRRELQRIMQAELARLPAAERTQVEGAIAAQLDQMVRRGAGTAEFRADGTVLFEEVEGGPADRPVDAGGRPHPSGDRG